MLPKKSKAKSKKKSKNVKETFIHRKVYEFLGAEDIATREQKYANHIKNLRDSLNYIEATCSALAQFNENLLIYSKWQEYANCSPYPKAYIPSDIRLLIEKLKYFENITTDDNTMSWRLLIDDRSILSQNILQKDLTQSALRAKKTNFGPIYEKDIDICLKMLQRIDDFLQNTTEVAKCDAAKLNDIKELKTILQQEIINFLNRFTYHVLSSEESYMDSIDAITCEYIFQSINFQMHIWALKNVPIRFPQLENPHFMANLHGVKVKLSIPTPIMKDNFVIRALHMNFDHISDNDQVFLNEAIAKPSTTSYEVPDLAECLNNEFLMQTEIMNRVRNELIQTRRKYEEQIQLFKNAEAKKKKKHKEEELTRLAHAHVQRLMKLSAEPEIIDENKMPDIQEEFVKEEQKQYENYLNDTYSPASLKLKAHEINLKKYFILGGIYQLYQIKKPQHTEFNSFNMTWHLNNAQLVVIEELAIPLDSQPQARRSTIYREPRKTLTLTRTESSEAADPDCPWFVLTIQLPEHLCYWGQPVVCQYEKLTKVITAPDLLLTDKQPHILVDSRSPDKYLPFLGPQKEGLTDSLLKLQHVSKDSFFRTSLSNVHLVEENLPLLEDTHEREGVFNTADFYLTSLLDKDQIRQIQRHVLLRMISSFKFDKEIQEDESEAIQNKSKTKAVKIKRKPSDGKIAQVTNNKHLFRFGPMQNNPERLIPIYAREEPLRLVQLKTDKMEIHHINEGVQTFAQLVKLINFIKWWHKVQIRKIIDLKPITSGHPVDIKSLGDVAKEQLKVLFSASSIPLSNPSKTRTKTPDNKSLTNRSDTSKTTFTEPLTSVQDSISTRDFVSFKDSVSKTHSFYSDLDEESNNNAEENLQTYSCSRWTTRNILKTEFNRETKTVVVQTNRLGIFALAFKQYEHFPFKLWKLQPSEMNPKDEVVLTLETQHFICSLYINENGIRCRVTEPTMKFSTKTKIYLTIDEPISNLKELKKKFQENFLNIFPDIDAKFYIENGYFSEKHLSTELHTYDCMAANSTQITFKSCKWNRLAKRRDIILTFLQYQDPEESSVDVRITPEEAFFVEITELCSDNLNEINLNFKLTWRNIGTSSDLNQLIYSVYPTVKEMKCKNAKLLNFVRNLLYEIRPLSFS